MIEIKVLSFSEGKQRLIETLVLMTIFVTLRICASSKIKTVRPSVKLENHVILSNYNFIKVSFVS